MKKSIKLLLGSFVIFSLIACGAQTAKSDSGKQESSVQESTTSHSSEESIKPSPISSSSSVISSNSSSSTEKPSSSSSSVVPSSSSSSSNSASSAISSSEEPSSSSITVSSSSSEQSSSSSSTPSESSSSLPMEVYYHITFVNDDKDETVLLEIDVLEGSEAQYSGETPTKEEDDEFKYEFLGWDKEEDLKAVSSNVTTKAVYNAIAKENWGPIIWF